jgi:hypothetical protein
MKLTMVIGSTTLNSGDDFCYIMHVKWASNVLEVLHFYYGEGFKPCAVLFGSVFKREIGFTLKQNAAFGDALAGLSGG